jgi:endonuclease/exonuclease/phosphatase family metal-dependent hydrolase
VSFVRVLLVIAIASAVHAPGPTRADFARVGGLAAQSPPSSAASVQSCVEPIEGVTWERWSHEGHEEHEGGNSADPRLNEWCASVGKPVLRSPVYVADADITHLRIVSWNIKVGAGRAEAFIPQQIHDAGPNAGVIVLLQEAFRAGWDVPDTYPRTLDVPHAIRPRRPTPDVVGLATQSELWVAYVPSMRNGPATSVSKREDRGNAILSTEPLRDVVAIELPFGRQRRVAVAATVTPRGSHAKPIRVVVLHFDRGHAHDAQAAALAARVKLFAADKTMPLVVAGDLNSGSGVNDAAVAALSDVVHREDACGTGRTMHWPLRLDVFFLQRLDFTFSTLDDFSLMHTCETMKHTMGSDHVPVSMTLRY